MVVRHLDVGDVARVRLRFWDEAGVPDNPDGVACTVRKPDGTVTEHVFGADLNFANPAVGTFTLEVPVDQAGTWRAKGTSVGKQAAARVTFVVDPDDF